MMMVSSKSQRNTRSSSLSCEEEVSAFLFPLFFPGMFFLACSSNSLLAVALGSKGLVDASPEEGLCTARAGTRAFGFSAGYVVVANAMLSVLLSAGGTTPKPELG